MFEKKKHLKGKTLSKSIQGSAVSPLVKLYYSSEHINWLQPPK